MIFNTTHPNKEYLKHTKRIVGDSYSFFEKIKKNGVGSSRLIIAGLSEKLQSNQQQFDALDYGNIEIRPNGVIVHFTNRLERYSWVIPYFRLVIYNATYFTIHANGNFIRFKKDKYYNNNKKFIGKIIDSKNKALDLRYYDY